MKTNQAGIDLLKSFEGCRLQSYPDIKGIPTIGYGHTGPGITLGMSWTQEQAEYQLSIDLDFFEKGVTSCVTVTLNENQFAALVCFSYNLGLHALHTSTLLKKVNANDMIDAADEFLKWDMANHVIVPGLLRRREAERQLFLTTVSYAYDPMSDGMQEPNIGINIQDIDNQ